jgi:nitrogenase molybdenum-iron protein beta chain
MGLTLISGPPEAQADIAYPEVAEAPRFTCALGGAYGSVLATFGAVPILHSGAGCGMANAHGMTFAGGLNSGGAQGTTTTPCSGLVEEHVVFGGEDKLRKLIDSTLKVMKGNLYAVISGCVPALIGDDVDSVVSEFSSKAPVIHVKTSGFVGNAYVGYEHYLEAVIDSLLVARPKRKRLVNLIGIVPNQHVFWKGELGVLKRLLESIGAEVNTILADFRSIDALRDISAAELNIVLNPWVGLRAAQKLQEKFDTPYHLFQYVPIGPKDTSIFLREIGKKLRIGRAKIERVIADEERHSYRFSEYMSELVMVAMPHAYTAIIGDSRTVASLARYGSNEMGWNIELAVVTDNPPEESRDGITALVTEGLEGIIKPKVFFEIDSHKIRQKLKEYSLQIILGSSLEKYVARKEHEAHHLSISYPIYDRIVLDRNYVGYRGGLALIEDISAGFGGPL